MKAMGKQTAALFILKKSGQKDQNKLCMEQKYFHPCAGNKLCKKVIILVKTKDLMMRIQATARGVEPGQLWNTKQMSTHISTIIILLLFDA